MPLTSSHTVIAPKDHQEALSAPHTSVAPFFLLSWVPLGNKEMGSARAVSLSGLCGLEHSPEDLLELQLPRRLQKITELWLVPLGMKEGAESTVLSLSGGILSIAICPQEKNRNYSRFSKRKPKQGRMTPKCVNTEEGKRKEIIL